MAPRLAMCSLVISMAVASTAMTISGSATAPPYPSQVIHIIGSFPAGSGADVIVRYFAEKLRVLSGGVTVVENKVGASGNIATQYVAKSKPDGYTILIGAGSGVAAATHLYRKPPVDALRELQVVGTINKLAFMIVVPSQSPYRSLGELTEGLRKKGDNVSYAQSNTTGKVTGELYKLSAHFSAVDIPYRTSNDSLNDFGSGRLDFGVVDALFASNQEREGRMRMLAVNTPERVQAFPEIPTMTELGVPVQIRNWFAAMVPAATPRPIVDQLNKWINEIEATEETRIFLNKFGGDPLITSPDEGQRLLASDIQEWAGFVRDAKIPLQD
jgi:tripartite-type tricarboxylate transporter receptor subunit TctC